MSLLSKADFKTKQQWLIKQRKELMKRQSQKYHQFNNSHKVIKQEDTLGYLLSSSTDEPYLSDINKQMIRFRSKQASQVYKKMTLQLQQRQEQMFKNRQMIRSMDGEMQQIRTQNVLLRSIQSPATQLLEHKQRIQQQNKILKAKYLQMEQYLISNGVIWHHNVLVGQLNINSIRQQIEQSKYKCNSATTEQQLQIIIKRVAELNQSLHNQLGYSQYVNVDGLFKLQKIPQISLVFYKNGISFGDIFHYYDSKQAKHSLDDLMQGYYPYLFNKQYPNGVIINLQGQLDKNYPIHSTIPVDSTHPQWFKGQHHSLSTQ